jgi:hypothetical protein
LIDTTVPGSPGFWMLQLWKQLQAEQPRLNKLDSYRTGKPPLVLGSERLQSAFYRFQSMSRSNFAELIVSAVTERMSIRSIRTAASDDDNGDIEAWRVWMANNLDVGATDVHNDMAGLGTGYVAVGAIGDDGEPVITIEDPRQTTTAQDPVNAQKTVAAFKIFHDPLRNMDYVYLWLPGQMWVARRPRRARVVAQSRLYDGPPPLIPVAFNPSSYELLPMGSSGEVSLEQPELAGPLAELDPDYDGPTSETYSVQDVPMVRFGNRRGIGEFELHTDLLDRINHTIMNKIVIITLQAFKQRAIELSADAGEDGGLPDEDENGNPIDYNDIFEADPGALWRLPIGAKIWESGQADITGVLSSARDDVLHLAAVSRTPFPMFSPDGANQSANGASLYREGLTFKVEDRCRIAGRAWAQVIALAFAFKGDPDRSKVAEIIVDWSPADRYSIGEMAQADSLSISLPRAQKFARIYGMSPAEVEVAMSQVASDAMLTQMTMAAAKPPPAPAAAPTPADKPAPAPDDSANPG